MITVTPIRNPSTRRRSRPGTRFFRKGGTLRGPGGARAFGDREPSRVAVEMRDGPNSEPTRLRRDLSSRGPVVADRVRQVEISGIRRMFEAAPPNSINLGLGEPDFEPPKAVIDALCHAVRHGMNHYGPSAGLPALREKIAERYRERDP